MKSNLCFKFFFLSLSLSSLTFAQNDINPSTFSNIEKRSARIENQIHELEDQIAAFEDDGVHDDGLKQNVTIEKAKSESSEITAKSLPMSEEEKSFLIAQEAVNDSSTSVIEERSAFRVDLRQAFSGSPIIYSILAFLSMFSFSLWFYSMRLIKKKMRAKKELLDEVKNKLIINQYDEAYNLLQNENTVISKMLLSLLEMRKLGHSVMLEAMRSEGKRATLNFWQKIGLLSDVAIMAPMLGLLGTVLGMFYAFYDINRSIESITTLFDGLGISVGTTVAGLIVALFAMMFHSLAKFKLVRELAIVENEAQSFVPLIDNKQP